MSGQPPPTSDDIEWPNWVERIEVYRDGPNGQFSCDAWVHDDAYWEFGEYSFIGWGASVSEAIRNAMAAGNAKARIR